MLYEVITGSGKLGSVFNGGYSLANLINILCGAVLYALNGGTHLARGLHGFFCQLAHFIRHHGKSTPGS